MRRTFLLLGGVLMGCPASPPDDVCGYGICDGGSDGPQIDAPANCDLSKAPKDSPACVDSAVGVFVDATTGKDSNAGTKTAPVQTLMHALDVAKQKSLPRLYVCEGTYVEDVVIDAGHDGISLYGGWKCTDWTYSGNKPKAGKGQTASQLDSLTKAVAVEDFEFDAADADPTHVSSTAMLINTSSSVMLARVKLVAGKGHDGTLGTLTTFTFPSQTALNGNNASGLDGGAANAVACPGGDTTTGGKGGDNGSLGSPGLPALDGGAGGALAACNGGGGGGDGASPGPAKDGSGAKSVGTFVSAAWTPESGVTGTSGSCGQGGGGGLGFGSGGGGGGGAGGCGGAAGGSGTGGGASIALAVVSSSVSVVASTLSSASAGNGGGGVAGQPGETTVGNGGLPTGGGCMGGKGGVGGAGGAGGGGAGGVSVGVLWQGSSQPTLDTSTQSTITTGTKGTKGVGGAPGTNDGVDGVAQAIFQSP